MSRADQIFIENCRHILDHGVWDTDQEVRPRWEDGTPAHTVKAFGIVNRYDLREEFPIITVRRQYLKSAVDELLWIWQKKSNNVHDLGSHVWDAWADEKGPSGKPTATSWHRPSATTKSVNMKSLTGRCTLPSSKPPMVLSGWTR